MKQGTGFIEAILNHYPPERVNVKRVVRDSQKVELVDHWTAMINS